MGVKRKKQRIIVAKMQMYNLLKVLNEHEFFANNTSICHRYTLALTQILQGSYEIFLRLTNYTDKVGITVSPDSTYIEPV